MTIRKQELPRMQGSAFFRPETVDYENRTVEIVFTTGEAGERYDWWNDVRFMESLRVDEKSVRPERLNKGLSIIDNHNRYAGISGVLGITEAWRIENGQLVGVCRFSKNQEAVFTDVADGILRHVSLGYRIFEYKVTKAQKGAIEQREAVDWEPLELSLVPVSFETTNGTRTAERDAAHVNEVKLSYTDEVEDMPKPNEGQRDEGAQDKAPAAAPVQETRAGEEASAVAQPTPAPQPKAEPEQRSESAAEVRSQLGPMLLAARAAKLPDQFAIDAFERGDNINDFRAAVLDEMGKEHKPDAVRSYATDSFLRADGRRDQGETLVRGAEEAIALRAGVRGAEDTDASRIYTGLRMLDIARHLLEAQGTRTMGMSAHKLAERAFNTTSDFPLILENVMHKSLLSGYDETPRTFVGLGRRATVNDFRAKHMYRLGDMPNLLPLGEHGEYKAASLSESKESYAIQTYARKLGYTRKMLINDDMSALSTVPYAFGQSGSRLESDIVWGLLLNYDFINGKAANILMGDGKPLFHADHKNLLTGASSALSKAALSDLRKLGRKMKTLDGNFMNVVYNALAVPEDLETVADELLFPSMLAAKLEDQPNRIRMDLIVEPRLSVVSDTSYYAFSNAMDTFEYAYLNGEEKMYTEVVTSTDVDGVLIKARHDFGAGLVDHRGMAKGAGA